MDRLFPQIVQLFPFCLRGERHNCSFSMHFVQVTVAAIKFTLCSRLSSLSFFITSFCVASKSKVTRR
ncbi:unnamed protein product [Meloidogyne enterolobii]|uniref:Uncharacterized protein n=2 Tax=Meloidogyne enterolobii TaxID=390850 RepID=A0ACB0XRA9_MELEN